MLQERRAVDGGTVRDVLDGNFIEAFLLQQFPQCVEKQLPCTANAGIEISDRAFHFFSQ